MWPFILDAFFTVQANLPGIRHGRVIGLEKTSSMKYNRDFRYLYRRGQSIAAGYLVLYYKKVPQPGNVLGITVTKKLGGAVVRNRVRRLIKECYRLREKEIGTGYKLVIVARNRAAGADFKAIRKDLSYLLKKSGILTAPEAGKTDRHDENNLT